MVSTWNGPNWSGRFWQPLRSSPNSSRFQSRSVIYSSENRPLRYISVFLLDLLPPRPALISKYTVREIPILAACSSWEMSARSRASSSLLPKGVMGPTAVGLRSAWGAGSVARMLAKGSSFPRRAHSQAAVTLGSVAAALI